MTAWFVTGTDTEVGKTLIAAALVHRLRERHPRVVGMKPIAAGSMQLPDGSIGNEDVAALRAASSVDVPPNLMNPYLLNAPVSPHIAAKKEGVLIDIRQIVDAFHALQERADAVIVEGAGGFRVPITDTIDGADLAQALGLPVILVVGLRLGCLNHAMLSAESIQARGLRLAGWVANRIAPDMPEQAANLEWLARRLDAPCLGDVPWLPTPDARVAAQHLRLPAPH
ncbi:dethiobiotin synthase [Piscinibacter terrae]|uniref:ATP-dependent dethiobiotin synthetase BioD n=1 Tax=Piscinibacter terrae TaxID=2496871 RepID=A0A3N7HST7_9BURK|nr:dethiobiotin synthase [Albitalea terrae]RQP23901.1 dethiobiotin synthase [Albitalea terrae]